MPCDGEKMPSTYAHYLFGEKVASRLGGSLAKTISENKQLFYIGLHGPDILFYYKPLGKNAVNSSGYAMHERPASEFFKRAGDILELTGNNGGSAAYIAGFICHYALDHACHGYIEKKIAASGLAHSEIENEFDRFLIYYNGKDLKHTDLTAHISATKENADVIAAFFEDITSEQIKKCLKSMKFYISFLSGNRAYKRFLVNFCLKISGQYNKMKSVIMNKKPIGGCSDSNKRLFKLFNRAVDDCLKLEEAYFGYLDGKNGLDERFDFTFGAGENWRDIPVYSAEEEDMYEV
ncbi:MAG: zinc dependent phospholipase C family protein [Clostridia bacterium]|nr:zinc dependent phospholipase C family protein [Clostridia bacterium]